MILKYNNRVVTHNDRWLIPFGEVKPYTIRILYEDGVTPSFSQWLSVKRVSQSPNVWDITHNSSNWQDLAYYISRRSIIAILDANIIGVTNLRSVFTGCNKLKYVALFDTSTVTDMSFMFNMCYSLPEVPLFNTSNVTSMSNMFQQCSILTNIPLFDTSKVIDISYAFSLCYKVKSGALALYRQASRQTNPPSNHDSTFSQCGRDTTTGYAELQQIPQSWGGLANG